MDNSDLCYLPCIIQFPLQAIANERSGGYHSSGSAHFEHFSFAIQSSTSGAGFPPHPGPTTLVPQWGHRIRPARKKCDSHWQQWRRLEGSPFWSDDSIKQSEERKHSRYDKKCDQRLSPGAECTHRATLVLHSSSLRMFGAPVG